MTPTKTNAFFTGARRATRDDARHEYASVFRAFLRVLERLSLRAQRASATRSADVAREKS